MLRRAGVLNVVLVGAIIVAIVLLFAQRSPSPGLEIIRGTPPPGVDVLLVHVSGAVRTPGLIEANPGDRVVDVLERAGGLEIDADRSAVNLARRVQDEDHIHVPWIGETDPLLDLNSASAKELEALPGIGPVYAGRIIDARIDRSFSSSDELLERGLIPERTYQQIRDLVTTN